jgi:signal transduction histidine kinase
LPVREKQILHDGDPIPFEVAGVLCELIDITAIKRLFGLKEEVVDRITYQVRNDAESLLAGVAMLNTVGLPDDKRGRVLSIIHDKVHKLVSVTQQITELLDIEVDASAMERYPIETMRPLHAAVDAVRSKATEHGIEFNLQLPELISLVFASPEGLQPVLESILSVLVTDTIQQGHIQVALEERDGWISYHFTNQGFGIPEERFQICLRGDTSLATDEFKKLRQSALWVERWGGALEGHSELGVGLRFELKLKGFI